MKKINSMARISVIIVFTSLLLRRIIELPDFIYGLGLGFGGALGVVVICELWAKKKYGQIV